MIIGTAGHIDHGKSALVTALTGRTMDRLAEEKRRGITIDLNFAPLLLDGLPPIGIIDVPGHEDFVRTMVAGASGIDLVMLVVDAAEGIRPQTLEHLTVVEHLGIAEGIPVLTKSDLVDAAWLELALAELTERLARSPVRFEPPAVASAVTGRGLLELRERIAAAAGRCRARDGEDLLRMPVDRVFTVAGVGTVVTGTLWSGEVAVGDDVGVEPGGHRARVRSIESFGAQTGKAAPGARIALGLSGVGRGGIERGHTVLDIEAAWEPVTAVDASIRLEADAPTSLGHRHRVRLHHGTAEVMARAYPREPIPPGQEGLARLALERPLILRGGDRFVLRRYSPVVTIGGGWVVDPAPPRRAPWPPGLGSRDHGQRLVALVARRADGLNDSALSKAVGLVPEKSRAVARELPSIIAIEGRWIHADLAGAMRNTILDRLEAFHRDHPSLPGLSAETIRSEVGRLGWATNHVLAALASDGAIAIQGGVVRLGEFAPHAGGGEEEIARLVEAIRAGGLEPPTIGELEGRLGLEDLEGAVRIALTRGLAVAVERDRLYAPSVLAEVGRAVRKAAGTSGEVVPAAVREALGISRKYLIPLLEWCDRSGLTRRDGNGRRYVS